MISEAKTVNREFTGPFFLSLFSGTLGNYSL